jgi:hypothetical protein
MTDRDESASLAEAARLLDDRTQQLTPVPALLDERSEHQPADVSPLVGSVDGHVL